jgi:hypothetical protein
VPDDVGARLVHAEHHEGALFLGKRKCIEKCAHKFAHQGEIRGVAGELDLLFHQACSRLRDAQRRCKHGRRLDSRKKALFSLPMRTIVFALVLIASNALAQEHPTAYNALRVVGTKFSRDAVNHIISVTGTNGTPQPETWKILLVDKRARGGVREIEVANGRIVSERTPVRSIVGSTEGATIDTSHLNLDSSGAYSVASRTAEKSSTPFATATYTLRTDERSEPIWIVTLQNDSHRPVGTIHIGANQGTVVRTEGMFHGAPMDQVVNADEADRDLGDEESSDEDENVVKHKIKRWFRQVRDDAGHTFQSVRRSFADFIRGEPEDRSQPDD